jgi:mRNA-degrading endonuclease RelE of RelBE toxin-antitoxin system
MKFFWTSQAERDLKAFPRIAQRRIATKMRWYESQEDPMRFVKSLTDMPGLYRFRIGEYRAIISPQGEVLSVLRIQKRAEAYR